jgi:hypothetical protein
MSTVEVIISVAACNAVQRPYEEKNVTFSYFMYDPSIFHSSIRIDLYSGCHNVRRIV